MGKYVLGAQNNEIHLGCHNFLYFIFMTKLMTRAYTINARRVKMGNNLYKIGPLDCYQGEPAQLPQS
jgi:hypothetical protein